MLSAVAIVFGLGIIVFSHELGHFIAARLAGLDVPRFSIGFPPHFIKRKIGKTEYCIGAIPLGGYVKVNLGTTGELPPPDVSWLKRSFVTLAGPFANLVLTALVLMIVFGIVGWNVSLHPTVVGNADNVLGLGVGDTVLTVEGGNVATFVEMLYALDEHPSGTLIAGTAEGRVELEYTIGPLEIPFHPLIPVIIGEAVLGMPAFESGLRAGDSIATVNGKTMTIWYDYQSVVADSDGELLITYYRDGIQGYARVAPKSFDGRLLTGVTVQLPTEHHILPPGRAIVKGITAAVTAAGEISSTLFGLFSRPQELIASSGGPLYVAETLGRQARDGLSNYLWTIAGISLAIMIFNLLPIPVLDGGQFIILVCEGVMGRPISKKGIQFIQQVGVVLILTIFVLIMFRDITRIVTRV